MIVSKMIVLGQKKLQGGAPNTPPPACLGLKKEKGKSFLFVLKRKTEKKKTKKQKKLNKLGLKLTACLEKERTIRSLCVF